ncbi:MAG: hypothetical protein RL060_1834 [Bacteroidota bacterium]|jgi:hypothetical protein
MKTLLAYLNLSEVFGYFFRKADPNQPKNFNLKVMHIINRIAVLLFLFCVLVMAYRYFTRK